MKKTVPVSTVAATRDHGGGLDAARARFGGRTEDWIDLSTGINPHAYPLPPFALTDWTRLPDQNAVAVLETTARRFWAVPDAAAVLPVPGLSAAIARIPALVPAARVRIAQPTYNEYAAAFSQAGWRIAERGAADAVVLVHPNNPTGAYHGPNDGGPADLYIIDESFCDLSPDKSLIAMSSNPGTIVLKSFGKFWGLAGLRLGFAIGDPVLLATLSQLLGPWAVSGPALRAGDAALSDPNWATSARTRLAEEAEQLDTLASHAGALLSGGTSLFRLYEFASAKDVYDRLAHARILCRIFPYSDTWVRLGIPPDAEAWARLERAL
ncbi:MAG: threonine-phosphate decarboxylase [Pseudomonadota bacterium]